jgi:hypothetical protein
MTLDEKQNALDQFAVLMDRQDREVNRLTIAMKTAEAVYERDQTQEAAYRLMDKCVELKAEVEYGQYLIAHIRATTQEMR